MLLFDQDVLILDEPTFGQDEKTARELIRRLKERQRQGTTIIMVTHDMELVDECADQVLVFHQGSMFMMVRLLIYFLIRNLSLPVS